LDVGAVGLWQEIFRFLRRGEYVELVFLAYRWRLPCRIDERLEEKRRRLDLVLLKAALSYARRGIPVFPCQPGGKRPLTYNGFWDATTDARRIKAWWGQWPSANIGVPTGKKSGLLALDIDSRGGGPESLAILEGQNGPLPDTARSRTGGGGVHVFFRYPTEEEVRNSAGWLGPGLDVRGEGGYVVVPPSSTQRAYEWIDRSPLAEAVWLLKCLSENDEKTLF
jgi:hypothetical protein